MSKALIDQLLKEYDAIQPQPCMGDEDSIYLTDRQQGYRDGLKRAIHLLQPKPEAKWPFPTGSKPS